MQEMVRESIGIAKDPSIFQSYSDFLPEARWLPKAEYEAKKQEEQAQMCLGHSDEQVKLENWCCHSQPIFYSTHIWVILDTTK